MQLEIGRLRAGSWISSRKTSRNSQVVMASCQTDSLTCPHWEEVPHFINDYSEIMCNIQNIHNTKFNVFNVFEIKMNGGMEIH